MTVSASTAAGRATDRPRWRSALCPYPEEDQGDPFLVEAPPDAGVVARYYVYVSAEGFPVYAGDDLADASSWRRIGESCPGLGRDPWCWAPCVRYIPGLARPWVMLYSRGAGAGDPAGHQHHQIRRADAARPEGPFRDSGEVLTPDLDFSIDPDVRVLPDGRLRLLFATDFVVDEPLGTGLVEADVDDELRRLTSALTVVARGHADWQVFDPQRSMPWKDVPGVQWDRGDTVRWTTLEGPAACTSPAGRPVVLYSGGNFTGRYGVGMVVEEASGQWHDVTASGDHLVLAPHPEVGLVGPGHCSVLTAPDGSTFLCYHFRPAPGEPRQFTVMALLWDADTDEPYVDLS
ncbi:MAG: family 43 glycosylhydrolase [bacterium]